MLDRSTQSNRPPRAPITFRVGIVGHRPNRLPSEQGSLDALRSMLQRVLEQVRMEVFDFASTDEAKALYSNHRPILRAVSSLAEGADRMFAEEGLDLGYQLLCPMPFHRDEFEKDFAPTNALEPRSLERFHELLERARAQGPNGLTVFELDGDRRAEGAAYGAAGRVVLNQSDLLIAVWDGGEAAGGGGTAQTLREALQYQVPVLWIHSDAPHVWQVLNGIQDLQSAEREQVGSPGIAEPSDPMAARAEMARAIKTIVREELVLPAPPFSPNWASMVKAHAAQYFQERRPVFNIAFVWKLFRNLIADGRLRLPDIIVRDFETQIERDWPVDPAPEVSPSSARAANQRQPTAVELWVNRQLRAHYAWADKRGDLYADAYRSSYILVYLLSAAAVFMALLPLAAGLEGTAKIISVAFELVILLLIVLLLALESARHWHERWLEYRLLAELIRQVRILMPLGGGRPFPRVPAHLGIYGSLDQTWMYWHMRAIARAIGIPNEKITYRYVRDCLDYIGKIVGVRGGGQLQFHHNAERNSHRIRHRLHIASTALFFLTIVSIAVHFALGLPWLHFEFVEHHHSWIDGWLVLFAATLPALGAALAGIANQGEFARLAKRSAAMAGAFDGFAVQIRELESEAERDGKSLSMAGVGELAAKIAEVMVDEVSDWRVVVIEPPVRA